MLLVLLLSLFLMTLIFANSFISLGQGNVWNGEIASQFKGEGTEENPYIITTAEELALLSRNVSYGYNYADKYFELGCDIVLNDSTDWQKWGSVNEDGQVIAPVNIWTPIGLYDNFGFKGYFDGKNYTVSGMYVNNVTGKHFGLFGYAYNYGEYNIKNVNVINSFVFGTNELDYYTAKVGGVVGYGDVDNCHFNGNVVGDDGKGNYIDVGGVVGYGDAINSTARGSVTANDDRSNAGGITGNGDATNCINYAVVNGNSVGGITGYGDAYFCENYGHLFAKGSSVGGITYNGTAQYCKNSGNITAINSLEVGGICANNYMYESDYIAKYCFNEGEIFAENCDYVGGIMGSGFAWDSYNTGNINLIQCESAGGVSGFTGYNYSSYGINRCYNVGNISGSAEYIGAVVGKNENNMIINNVFYLEDSYSTDEYAIKLTTEQMKKRNNFTYFNFNKVWEYIEDAEYPYPTLRCFGSKIYGYGVEIYDGETLISTTTVVENEPYIFRKLSDKGDIKFYAFERDGKYYFDGDSIIITEDMSFNVVWTKKNVGSGIWDGKIDTEWEGSGSEEDPYLIKTGAELAGIGEMVNNGENFRDKYFTLENDIYLNDIYDFNYMLLPQNQWEPIGSGVSYYNDENEYINPEFDGNFDGKEHTVYGLYIKSNSKYIGLFGYGYGTVKNLTVKNSYICALPKDNYEDFSVGAIAGRLSDVYNCKNYATVEYAASKNDNGRYNISGIAGYSYNTIENCENYGSVRIKGYLKTDIFYLPEIELSGIVGSGRTVKGCKNYADVYTENVKTEENRDLYLSGIASYASNITNCENYGEIYSPRIMFDINRSEIVYVSGIANYVSNISNCKNFSNIRSENISVGIVYNARESIENCENTGTVSGEKAFGIAYKLTNAKYLVNNGNVNAYNFCDYSQVNASGISNSINNASDCLNTGKIDVNITQDGSEYDTEVSGLFIYTEGAYYPEETFIIERCVNKGQVSYRPNKEHSIYNLCISGIIGRSNGYALVRECINNGAIYASKLYVSTSNNDFHVGGIAAKFDVENSYNTGLITAIVDYSSNDRQYMSIGGVVGNGSAINCYNVGTINIINNSQAEQLFVGGVVGIQTDKRTVDSYYLNSCIKGAQDSTLGGIEKTDTALKNKATFSNYDFNKYWEMGGVAGYSYPNLRFVGSGTHRYFVTFKDFNNTISTEMYYNDSVITFSIPMVKSGYTFEYWQMDDVKYFEGDQLNINGNMTFDAVWTKHNTDEAWDGSVDTELEGSGTEEEPYLISNAAELKGLNILIYENADPNYISAYYKLTNDIYMNSAFEYSSTVMAQNVWVPICEESKYKKEIFSGVLDGDGYTVYGLYMKSDSLINMSLFGIVDKATIKNITFKNGYIYSSNKNRVLMGAVISEAKEVTLINCNNYIKIESVAQEDKVGGLVGYAYSINAQNTTNYGNIKGKNVGGIVGNVYPEVAQDTATFVDCKNFGEIINAGHTNTTFTGGIVGLINNGYGDEIAVAQFENCVNEGKIYDKRGYSAGIIGQAAKVKMTYCVNNADIYGKAGIVGAIEEVSFIENVVNNGDIINEYGYAAGIAADVDYDSYSRIVSCENNGNVTAYSYAAGFVCYGENTYFNTCVNNGNIESLYEDAAGIVVENEYSIWDSINNGSITATGKAGGICASGTNISFSTNNGSVLGNTAGGILACTTTYYAHLQNCTNTAAVTGTYYTGGIVADLDYSNNEINNCVNTGNISGRTYCAGGIAGESAGKIKNCYNAGNIYGECNNTGGIVGDGDAMLSYNKGDVRGAYSVGGITGYGDATDCFSACDVKGDYRVGGICGYGKATHCYVLGTISGETYVASITSSTVTDCYYNAAVSVNNEYYEPNLTGTFITLEDLKLGNMPGFDFENTWQTRDDESYPYPVLKDTAYYVTYSVTFVGADGKTVLKQQKVNDGFSAYPPVIEPFADETYVYALDHWDGNYKNINKDTTIKAVYKKTEKIKFNGRTFNFSVPFGYSMDNLTAKIESEYRNIIAHTTHGYKMKVETEFDLSSFEINTSGVFEFIGKALITESPYYEMAQGENFKIKVTVNPSLDNEFDIADLEFMEENDNIIITGYNGNCEEIRIPEKINGKVVKKIGDNAFMDNQKITSIYLPDSVEIVGSNSFKNAVNLVTVSFGENLKEIGEYAFYNTSIISITLNQGIEFIGENTFGIYDNAIIRDFTVYCFKDSYAENYAKQNGLNVSYIAVQENQATGITATTLEGLTLNASKVVGGDYYETAQNITEEANVSLFEITLSSNTQSEIQPDNMLRITIPLPEGYGNDAKIYRINADGSYLDMNAVLSDGKLVFNTAHLSYYAIVSKDNKIIGDCNGDGIFNTVDLAELKLFLASLIDEIGGGADINNDGDITTVDLAEIKLMLAGLK